MVLRMLHLLNICSRGLMPEDGVSLSGIFGNVNCQIHIAAYHHGDTWSGSETLIFTMKLVAVDFSEFSDVLTP